VVWLGWVLWTLWNEAGRWGRAPSLAGNT
jgi:hypothetical protein